MKTTKELIDYLKTDFIFDVLFETNIPPIEKTTDHVWGREVKLLAYRDDTYATDSFQLENWYANFDLANFNTVEELKNEAVKKINEIEKTQLQKAAPAGNYENLVLYQLLDWRVLIDEQGSPVINNDRITLVKYAKIIDTTEYKAVSGRAEDVSEMSLDGTICIKNTDAEETATEVAYKRGIKDVLDWLMNPANEDQCVSDEGDELPYYFVYENDIKEFMQEKGIK